MIDTITIFGLVCVLIFGVLSLMSVYWAWNQLSLRMHGVPIFRVFGKKNDNL